MDKEFQERTAELLESARKADKIDKERIQFFEAMVKSPGWPIYLELLNLRIQAFADAVLAPAGSVDGAVALEYVKGTMSGLVIARDLPSVIITAMKTSVPATDGDTE